MTPQILKNAASGTGAHLIAQVSTQNWRSRIVLSVIAVASGITALGHVPGWVPTVTQIVEGVEVTTPGYWVALGDALFEWVGMVGVALAAGWNTPSK